MTHVLCRTALVRFWHEAAVRKCPLLRRLWGVSGHPSAIAQQSSIYEYTPSGSAPGMIRASPAPRELSMGVNHGR